MPRCGCPRFLTLVVFADFSRFSMVSGSALLPILLRSPLYLSSAIQHQGCLVEAVSQAIVWARFRPRDSPYANMNGTGASVTCDVLGDADGTARVKPTAARRLVASIDGAVARCDDVDP